MRYSCTQPLSKVESRVHAEAGKQDNLLIAAVAGILALESRQPTVAARVDAHDEHSIQRKCALHGRPVCKSHCPYG